MSLEIKDFVIEGMEALGYTPQTLITSGDAKLNTIIAKRIQAAKTENPKVKTGFLKMSENPSITGKPNLVQINIIDGVGAVDGGTLDIKADFLDNILTTEEQKMVGMMEKLGKFNLEEEIKKLYKSINTLLRTEMIEKEKKVCCLILVGKGKMNINICTIEGANYQPYKKINFADFATDIK